MSNKKAKTTFHKIVVCRSEIGAYGRLPEDSFLFTFHFYKCSLKPSK